MEKIEYRNVIDKSDWPRGPWDDEPDKVQWVDDATGLPCLAVRGPGGHWCGYVGVLPGHPYYQVEYGQCPHGENCPEKKGDEHYSWCDHRPESFLQAHGGITFSNKCADLSREHWEKWRERTLARRGEAKKYPLGDSARALKEWAAGLESYDAWLERATARHVCHRVAPGEPDDVWWFGFDCAHSGDLSPSYVRSFGRGTDVYRDLAYVQAECREMARQLSSPPTPQQLPQTQESDNGC